jgi:hypothetical protein
VDPETHPAGVKCHSVHCLLMAMLSPTNLALPTMTI